MYLQGISIRPGLSKSGLLGKMGTSPLEAQWFRAKPVGLRVAAGHLPLRKAFERGLEVHVHSVLLCTHRLQRCVDVHHELHAQPLSLVE